MKAILPGFALSTAVAVAAMALCQIERWPFHRADGSELLEPVMVAILLGLALSNFLRLPKRIDAGTKFSVKKVLPFGIVLLGARLDMNDVLRAGLTGALLSAALIALAMGAAWFLGKRFGVGSKLAALIGVGSAICGGSAILATAPTIEAEDRDVALSVSIVSLLGAAMMFLLPTLASPLSMTDGGYAHWAGLAIPQMAQVVAAGFAVSESAGDLATIVKLARVCLLAPALVAIGVLYRRSRAKSLLAGGFAAPKTRFKDLVPLFIWGFLAMSLLKTYGVLTQTPLDFVEAWTPLAGKKASVVGLCGLGSKLCLVIAMAAVGLETKWAAIKAAGSKPLWLGIALLAFVAAFSYGAVRALGM